MKDFSSLKFSPKNDLEFPHPKKLSFLIQLAVQAGLWTKIKGDYDIKNSFMVN